MARIQITAISDQTNITTDGKSLINLSESNKQDKKASDVFGPHN